MKILMVCLGNICRSPLAEGILKDKAAKAGLQWTIDSAGTNGYHDGDAPHHLSQKVARLNGIEICDQRSRRITGEDFHRFDKIYAMSRDVIEEMKWIAKKKYDASKVELLMNELKPGKNLDVPDPWFGTEPGYHAVFKMISDACEAIIAKAQGTRDKAHLSAEAQAKAEEKCKEQDTSKVQEIRNQAQDNI